MVASQIGLHQTDHKHESNFVRNERSQVCTIAPDACQSGYLGNSVINLYGTRYARLSRTVTRLCQDVSSEDNKTIEGAKEEHLGTRGSEYMLQPAANNLGAVACGGLMPGLLQRLSHESSEPLPHPSQLRSKPGPKKKENKVSRKRHLGNSVQEHQWQLHKKLKNAMVAGDSSRDRAMPTVTNSSHAQQMLATDRNLGQIRSTVAEKPPGLGERSVTFHQPTRGEDDGQAALLMSGGVWKVEPNVSQPSLSKYRKPGQPFGLTVTRGEGRDAAVRPTLENLPPPENIRHKMKAAATAVGLDNAIKSRRVNINTAASLGLHGSCGGGEEVLAGRSVSAPAFGYTPRLSLTPRLSQQSTVQQSQTPLHMSIFQNHSASSYAGMPGDHLGPPVAVSTPRYPHTMGLPPAQSFSPSPIPFLLNAQGPWSKQDSQPHPPQVSVGSGLSTIWEEGWPLSSNAVFTHSLWPLPEEGISRHCEQVPRWKETGDDYSVISHTSNSCHRAEGLESGCENPSPQWAAPDGFSSSTGSVWTPECAGKSGRSVEDSLDCTFDDSPLPHFFARQHKLRTHHGMYEE